MKRLNTVITIFGAYQLAKPFYWQYCYYEANKTETQLNHSRIQKTYNKSNENWALVTGSSEGIGRAYALDLALCGFNLILASRSSAKLNQVKTSIQTINPNSKV